MEKPSIAIVVKQGKVVGVICRDTLPIKTVIHNYDVEGLDPKLLSRDEDGALYQVQLTASPRKVFNRRGGPGHG